MSAIVVIGAGGHGREVAAIVRECAHTTGDRFLGFIDEDPSLAGQVRDDAPVLGGWDWFEGSSAEDVRVILGVGAPAVRRRHYERCRVLGLQFTTAISPRAVLSELTQCGEGVTIFPNVVVSTGVTLGAHAILNVAATVSHDCVIGPFAFLGPGTHLAGAVTLGEGTLLGTGVNVIPGCTVGAWSVIGAGATVISDIPGGVTAVGVPARAR